MSATIFGGLDGGIVDTMIGLPTDHRQLYETLRRQALRDSESQDMFMPAAYMFHDVPHEELDDDVDPVAVTLAEMDRYGVEVGLLSLTAAPEAAERALTDHPDRFVPSLTVDPNRGMEAVRELVAAHDRWGVRAVSVFPHGVVPQVAIDAPLMYPIYAKCVELGRADLRHRRRRRTASALEGPEGRARRPGHVRLPRPRPGDAPRRRALGRHGREAHGQVAEPSLLDLGLRSPLVPAGDRRLTRTAEAPNASSTPGTSRWD